MGTDVTVPLGQYLRPLRDHVKLIAAVTVVVAVLGFLVSLLVPASYRSTASILVTPISADPTSTFESDVAVGMETEVRIATSTAVVVQVADRLAEQSIDVDIEDLSTNVVASSPKDSRILDVSYDAPSPTRAQAGAETFAQTYLDYRSQLANEDKDAAVESLRERITLLKDELAEISAELLRYQAGSESFITVSVEKESIKSELDAQQDALANLSTLSIEVGRIISPAERPDAPQGLGVMAVIFGALIGGLVLGCIAAFVVAAFRESAGSDEARSSPLASTPAREEPVASSPAGEAEVARSPAATEPLVASPVGDEELKALFRADLWDDGDGQATGWPSSDRTLDDAGKPKRGGERKRPSSTPTSARTPAASPPAARTPASTPVARTPAASETNGRTSSPAGRGEPSSAERGRVPASTEAKSEPSTDKGVTTPAGKDRRSRADKGITTPADKGAKVSTTNGLSPVSEPSFEPLLSRLRESARGRSVSCVCFGESSREASLAVGLGLACALQDAGSQVLVIDLTLDGPALGGLLNLPADPGLLDVLDGTVSLDDAQHPLPRMGDLRALTLGGGASPRDRKRIDDLVNGWGMRKLLGDTASSNQDTIFIGGSLAEAERLDLVVRETGRVVVGTEQPEGEKVGGDLVNALFALPADTLGLISLDAALAIGASRGTGVPGA